MEKQDLLQRYRDGLLTKVEEVQLEKLITEGVIQIEELDNFDHTVDLLEVTEEMPSFTAMDDGFYKTLNDERPHAGFNFNRFFESLINPALIWKLALSLGLILVAFWMGVQYETGNKIGEELTEKPEMIHALLSARDVSDRIHLVSSASVGGVADAKVIEALLYTLMTDESTNVRLACIDVLINYSQLPVVREGLIGAISRQSSPTVLISLADAIKASGNDLDKAEYQALIRKDLPPQLQQSMEVAITNI